jgi:CheY-like chemotaxis protein
MTSTILWVEDNPHDVILMQTALTEKGLPIEFILADNALAAFRYLDARSPYEKVRRPPDLVIIDINLPAINGIAVLNELARQPLFHGVPRIVLTSTLDPLELQACLDHGAMACLLKPAVYEGYLEIVEKIKRYLPVPGPAGSVDTLTPPPTSESDSSKLIKVGSFEKPSAAQAPPKKPG